MRPDELRVRSRTDCACLVVLDRWADIRKICREAQINLAVMRIAFIVIGNATFHPLRGIDYYLTLYIAAKALITTPNEDAKVPDSSAAAGAI